MRLDDLARMYIASQPKEVDTGPKFITAGNRVMGMDVSTPSPIERLGGSLNHIAMAYLTMDKMRKQKNLIDSIKNIMGSDLKIEDTTDENGNPVMGKKSKMLQVLLSYGDELPKQLADVRNTLLKEIGKKKTIAKWGAKVVNGKLVRYNTATGEIYKGDMADNTSGVSNGLLTGNAPSTPPQKVGKYNPLRILPNYAYYGDKTDSNTNNKTVVNKKPLKPQKYIKYIKGKLYRDKKGRIARYKGNGKWDLL